MSLAAGVVAWVRRASRKLASIEGGCELTDADRPPSVADRSAVRAFQAWGSEEFLQTSKRFSPSWRVRLKKAAAALGDRQCGDAWTDLRREHAASARPDPDRVHPSWYIRALRSESLAVKLAVTANSSPSLRSSLIQGLEIDPGQLTPEFPPDPDAIVWASALWAERLVGALPETDDPPVIVAITRLSPLNLTRLIKVCGLAKHAFALNRQANSPIDESRARFTPIDRVRLAFFRRRIGTPDPRLVPLATEDLKFFGDDRRRAHLRLGLVTFGRLLDFADVHRSRWAVQHLPYSVAKLVRQKMSLSIPKRAAFSWETWILEVAWSRLLAEKRLTGGRDWLGDLDKEEES